MHHRITPWKDLFVTALLVRIAWSADLTLAFVGSKELLPYSRSSLLMLHHHPPPPRLHIVIPAYNEENRILPTLESYRDFLQSSKEQYTNHTSLLVVDDGSSDDTARVVKSFAENARKRS